MSGRYHVPESSAHPSAMSVFARYSGCRTIEYAPSVESECGRRVSRPASGRAVRRGADDERAKQQPARAPPRSRTISHAKDVGGRSSARLNRNSGTSTAACNCATGTARPPMAGQFLGDRTAFAARVGHEEPHFIGGSRGTMFAAVDQHEKQPDSRLYTRAYIIGACAADCARRLATHRNAPSRSRGGRPAGAGRAGRARSRRIFARRNRRSRRAENAAGAVGVPEIVEPAAKRRRQRGNCRGASCCRRSRSSTTRSHSRMSRDRSSRRCRSDMMEASKLPALGYTSAVEALAEKFHSSPALLRNLNPGATWAAGEVIKVPDVEPFELPSKSDKPAAAAKAAAAAKPAAGASPRAAGKPAAAVRSLRERSKSSCRVRPNR